MVFIINFSNLYLVIVILLMHNALVKLFSVCTDTSTLPSIWKSANLSALFKNGSKTDPLNYKPVSLTCVIC